MQQTDKYQLNLIETTDTFSPAPLNENAHKLEAALESVRAGAAAGDADLAAADAALDQRVTALELHKIAIGTFNAGGQLFRTVDVGFAPIAVLVTRPQTRGFICFAIKTYPIHHSSSGVTLELTETGFLFGGQLIDSTDHNFFAIC